MRVPIFLKLLQGSIAVTAAAAFVAVLAGAGVAIDYARYSRAQAALQSTLDSAAHAAVEANRQDPDLSEKKVQAIAKKQFEVNNTTDASIETRSRGCERVAPLKELYIRKSSTATRQ